MTASSSPRLHRLRPSLIRALIPAGMSGTYVLFRQGEAVYIGRSDQCLRRRLLVHARSGRGQYFRYQIHNHALDAFGMECAMYHDPPDGQLENELHPAPPHGSSALCPFCVGTLQRTHKERFSKAL